MSWFALAAIAAISMLPIHHRQHDAKLLLLTYPAGAILWSERGAVGWSAVLINLLGAVGNGDLFSRVRILLTRDLLEHADGRSGQILTVICARPMPLIVLLTASFYLWIYARHAFHSKLGDEKE